MRLSVSLVAMALAGLPASLTAREAEPDDLLRLKNVSSPDIAPSGEDIAYVVRTHDLEKDRSASNIWTVKWDGTGQRQLTGREGESESSPDYSPDGSMLGFLSSRGDGGSDTRLWLLPLAGGEARPIEGVEGSISDFAWSPDSRKLALIVQDPKPEAPKVDGKDQPQPIVIDRFAFKQDGVGYLDNRRERLWLYDLGDGSVTRVTDGDFDESQPAFSPDGSMVAFTSNRTADPDRSIDSNIYVANVGASEATPRQLTTFEGSDSSPVWSNDGETIAYLRGGDPEGVFYWYAVTSLASVPASGGAETVLTAGLDRNVTSPVWSVDDSKVHFIIEDDGNVSLASVSANGGPVSVVAGGEREITAPTAAPNGRIALLSATTLTPFEIHAVENGGVRKLTSHNDALMAELDLGRVERYSATASDGNEVRGFVHYPHGYNGGDRLPTILHLHGGPTSQYDTGFDMLRHIMAASGYAVVAPNPRGSTGRGEAYAAAIDAAWGSVDVLDVLASAEHAVAEGYADGDKLGVGGWSYGGMLTNYTIASDPRFAAAVSGASISNILGGYGTDHYALAYEDELGTPWENLDTWMAISYPFFQAQKIVTPTLFMAGGTDVNVPTWSTEQMYQALKSLEIDTQLVIYPGQPHRISRPSFVKDRAVRWIGWFDERLKD